MKRKIITIDADKCTGCGLCIPDCPEGALQMVDGKARLVSDLFCDGLGACIGTCPEGAITIEEREAVPYDEKTVMENIVKQGDAVILAHLEHLKEHGENKLLNEALEFLDEKCISIPRFEREQQPVHVHGAGCPGSMARTIERSDSEESGTESISVKSELKQWPVQLKLLNPSAPYFDNADLLLAADCVPFAYGNFHNDFLKDKVVIMFCPKLDPYIEEYIDKMIAILSNHEIKSISVVHMEVPCCGGLNYVLEQAKIRVGKDIPVKDYTISINGEIL